MKTQTLLIDAVTSLGSGHLELQRELAQAAARCAPKNSRVILLQANHVPVSNEIDGLDIVRVPHPGFNWLKRWKWFQYDLPSLAKTLKADIFYSLSGILSRPLINRFPCIGTVNNMVPFTPLLMNQRPLFHKERLRLEILRREYVWSLRRAHALLLHSQFALKQTEPYTGPLEKKAVVCYTGMPSNLKFDSQYPPAHPLQGKDYLFYLSALQWYKNHENLIKAYRILRDQGAPPPLFLAGPSHDLVYEEKIKKLVSELNLTKDVHFLGALSREQIPSWLHHAKIHIFASLCETNSVILAETMGVHGALLVSKNQPMPEIVGNSADFFDPKSPTNIAQAIQKLIDSPERLAELRLKASVRTQDFSWDGCGSSIWQAAEMALENFKC
jgi:glycosyltransferase involved in cell wall biosynthesis